MIADAPSSIAAGRDGGFGLLNGLHDGTRTDQLLPGGADTVVADLREVVVRTFIERMARQLAEEQNTATKPVIADLRRLRTREEQLREALCVTGNGYIATRGAAPESSAGNAHYPGMVTTRAGGESSL